MKRKNQIADNEQLNKELENQRLQAMAFYQNLVPGTADSPLIQNFKEKCIEKETDQDVKAFRSDLLKKTPPILSFDNEEEKNEEKEFYLAQALAESDCNEFCCLGIQVPSEFYDDNYKASFGTGKLYEGSTSSIKNAIQSDLISEAMDSQNVARLKEGLSHFDSLTEQQAQLQTQAIQSTAENNTSGKVEFNDLKARHQHQRNELTSKQQNNEVPSEKSKDQDDYQL